MVGPYVARGSVDLAALRSCINVSASDWSVFRSGPSWISAQMRPHYRTASNGTRVRMRRERPVLHLVSSSRRPRQGNGTRSSLSPDQCSSFVRAMKPFLRAGRVFRGIARRAVKAGRRAKFSTTSTFPGHALRAPSTVPRSSRLGRHRARPDTFEVTPLC